MRPSDGSSSEEKERLVEDGVVQPATVVPVDPADDNKISALRYIYQNWKKILAWGCGLFCVAPGIVLLLGVGGVAGGVAGIFLAIGTGIFKTTVAATALTLGILFTVATPCMLALTTWAIMKCSAWLNETALCKRCASVFDVMVLPGASKWRTQSSSAVMLGALSTALPVAASSTVPCSAINGVEVSPPRVIPRDPLVDGVKDALAGRASTDNAVNQPRPSLPNVSVFSNGAGGVDDAFGTDPLGIDSVSAPPVTIIGPAGIKRRDPDAENLKAALAGSPQSSAAPHSAVVASATSVVRR